MRKDDSAFNPLTPEEERVIIHKGTERPYTGAYTDNKDAGVIHLNAHSIKGAAANVSGVQIMNIALAMEEAAKREDLEAAAKLLVPLQVAFQNFGKKVCRQVSAKLADYAAFEELGAPDDGAKD